MADEEHLKILRQGVAAWNDWREKNPEVLRPDLNEANLIRANLSGANLSGASLRETLLNGADLNRALLSGADLNRVHLFEANLSEAHLSEAHLIAATLSGANLSRANLGGAILDWANLSGATLSEAHLSGATLSEAHLSGANLVMAQLIGTDLRDATLTGSRVYGASVWNIKVDERTKQQNLVITDRNEPVITVDNIKVAQFIYLLLNNEEIRDVIDTITSKAVLILGRFSKERKPILDALREELRKHDYLPILFDFEATTSQSTIETITTLARMARFVIADLTDAKSVLQELQAIVPDLPSVAVRFLIKSSQHEPGMLDHIKRYPWVIKDAYRYKNVEEVIASIEEKIIGPAEARVQRLRPPKRVGRTAAANRRAVGVGERLAAQRLKGQPWGSSSSAINT
jgi:uncharacterized protein YjbI with pentapeptide repeats